MPNPPTPYSRFLPHAALFLLLGCLPACRNTPADGEAPPDPAAQTNTEDAGAGTEAALARAGISLADLPELADPLPGGYAAPPEDGLLPTSLPAFADGMDDILPELQSSGASAAIDAPGGWHRSGQAAIRDAQARGRPLIIWFANTQAGPLDNMIGSQVLFQPAAAKILADTATGLRVDFGNDTTRKSSYYQGFRKRFKITGYPTLVFLMPDGTESSRQVGFSAGTAEARQQNFARDAEKAAAAWKSRRAELAKAGFQTWHNRQGRPFFAKALRRTDREAILIDPFRKVHRVPLERFSHESLVDLLDRLPTPPPLSE